MRGFRTRFPVVLLTFLWGVSGKVAAQTVLTPGDLAIVGINANNSCIASTNDEISFVCFKNITTNTRFIITDCGYQTQNAGLWGDNEGVVQLWYTGAAPILAGTVLTIRQNGAVTVVSPVGAWTITNLLAGFNLNSLGEQMFIFQPTGAGPYWTNPAGTNNGSFSNCTLLYAFNTKAAWTPYTYTGVGTGTTDSDLPPGSLCFSMNPTSGTTDYAKFTDAVAGGGFATRNQRTWIIDIDNVANWNTSYGNCTNYNSGAPNYAAGFVIPITAGTFTNGLWTGAKTTDWFDCRNWDDAEVPIATSNVMINQTAINNCVVGTLGSVAVCDTLDLQTSSTARTLTINANSSLVVGGPVNVRCTGGAGATLTVTSGSFTTNSLTMTGTASLAGNAVFRDEVSTNTVNVQGPLTINQGGLLDLQGSSNGGVVFLSGNWTNNDGETTFQDTLSTIYFTGSSPQSITTAGAVQEVFNILNMNKVFSSHTVSLNAPVRIRTNLGMNRGKILPSGQVLSLQSSATTTGATDSSFVHGPVTKYGTADFDFPIGKGNQYRTAGLTGITGAATDAFTAEYFAASPRTTFNNVLASTLDHISDCEYWIIARYAGTADATVKLSWEDPTSCGVTLLTDLKVARWDGAMWLDRGNGGTSGTTLAGTVVTSAQQTLFSPWTLASTTAQNPLPIELLSFTAQPAGGDVDLDWTTATEVDNDHFTVERSGDLEEWVPIAEVEGAGNSEEQLAYTTLDTDPLRGVNFYRLRQFDVDGNSTLSGVVSVTMVNDDGLPIAVFTNGDMLYALHDMAAGSSVTVVDAAGRIMLHDLVKADGVLEIPATNWAHGVYVLRLSDGTRVVSERFAY